MTYKEAYQILGINEQASSEEIKKAYKAKAKKYHPDIYQGDKAFAEEKMKQINEAYAILSTPYTYTTSSTDYSYGSQTYNFDEEFQRAREQWRKIYEDLERIQKEIEENNRKMEKMFKRLLIFLFCTLEFYIILLFVNAVRSIIFYFNEEMWFFFAYFILLGVIALLAVILAPLGFRWLLKRAGIIK